MPSVELKITRIGNSRGIRIPAETLRRYAIGDAVIMEERSDGIFLRPVAGAPEKLSWAETATEMAAAGEDWSECDTLDTEGMDDLPWNPVPVRRVAEPQAEYGKSRSKKKRS